MSPTRKAHLDTFAITLLLACCMFWGFQQVLLKATVAEVPPVFQAFVRFAMATAAIGAWCLWRGRVAPGAAAPQGSWRAGLLAGALFAGEFACIYVGLQYTSASRLTVFLYSSPFCSLTIGTSSRPSFVNLTPPKLGRLSLFDL
jgi:drug/metabolite transporter (DMT)-like permease